VKKNILLSFTKCQ